MACQVRGGGRCAAPGRRNHLSSGRARSAAAAKRRSREPREDRQRTRFKGRLKGRRQPILVNIYWGPALALLTPQVQRKPKVVTHVPLNDKIWQKMDTWNPQHHPSPAPSQIGYNGISIVIALRTNCLGSAEGVINSMEAGIGRACRVADI